MDVITGQQDCEGSWDSDCPKRCSDPCCPAGCAVHGARKWHDIFLHAAVEA